MTCPVFNGYLAQLVESTCLIHRRFLSSSLRVPTNFGGVAQLVERGPEEPRVGGSTPPVSAIYCAVAQLVGEHQIHILEVVGSSPSCATILW